MRARGSASPRNLAILGGLLGLAAIPIACAQGLVLTGPETHGAGGGSKTTGTGGNGGSPDSVTSSGHSTSHVSSSQVSSSGGPSSECDGEGDCTLCVTCAQCVLCSDQANACANSPACTNIVTCAGGCADGDQACLQDCLSSNPSGEQAFDAYNLCLGCACEEDCQIPASDCQ
jgi:hypothetical protein